MAERIRALQEQLQLLDHQSGTEAGGRILRLPLQIGQQKVRDAAILDPELLVPKAPILEIDGRGDCRADVGVDFPTLVQRRRQEIAVAAPVLPQQRADGRQGAMDVAIAQKKLGRPEGAGCEHHQFGILDAGHPLATVQAIELNPPAAADRLDPVDEMKRPDLDMEEVLRPVEIVEVERVPGRHRAADIAGAEMNTAALRRAVLVHIGFAGGLALVAILFIGPIRIEMDGKVELAKALGIARRDGGVAHQLHALCPLAGGNGLNLHDLRHPVVERLQAGVIYFRRPSGDEGGGRGLGRDIGVDVRATADRGSLRDGHVREQAQVEPAIIPLRALMAPQPGIFGAPREIILVPAPAAFKHQDTEPGLGKPEGRDRATEATTDHDCIE